MEMTAVAEKKGFKETEIGWIPTDWVVTKLGEVCEKPEYGFTARATSNPNGKKFLRITDIIGHSVNWENVPYCECSQKEFEKYRLKVGDVLFARIGATTGKTCLVRDSIEAIYASYLIRVRSNGNLDPEFLHQFTQTTIYWDQINANKGGRLKQGVNIPILAELMLPFPKLSEQQAIASTLMIVKDAITTQEKIITNLRALKAATMAKLFREGLQNEPLKQTEIGEIPESWQIVPIKELGNIVTGSTPPIKNPDYYGGNIPFIAPGDIDERRIVWGSEKKLSESGSEVSRSLPPRSVMVVCIGSTIGKVGMTNAPLSCTNQQINSIVCNDSHIPEFIHYCMRWNASRIKKLSTPSPVPILTKGSFGQIPVVVPKKDEQDEIAKVLCTIDDCIEIAEKKKTTISTLFVSMLHLLMTGQVRVRILKR